MKKFYFIMLTALLAAGINFGAKAQDSDDRTITVTWDTPGAVIIEVQNSVVEIPDGDTSVTITRPKSAWASAKISPASGYTLESCTYTDAEGAERSMSKVSNYYYSISINSNDGLTFHVTTSEVVKDSKFTVNVINGASKLEYVQLTSSQEKVTGLVNGANEIEFSKAVDSQAYVLPKNGITIYSVLRNGSSEGVDKKMWNSYYTVDIADGDVIDVRVYEGEEPEVRKCTVTVDIDGPAGCLYNIFNRSTLEEVELTDGKFEAEVGNIIRVNFNEDYDIVSFKAGGEDVAVYDQSATYTVKEDVTFSIVAREKVYSTVEYTAYIVCPEGVEIWAGNRLNGEKLELTGGEVVNESISLPASDVDGAYTIPAGAAQKFTLEVSSKYSSLNIYDVDGYWMRTKRLAVMSNYADNPVTDKTFYVVAEPVENDSKAVVYLAGDAGRITLRPNAVYGATKAHAVPVGYSELDFDYDYESPFSVGCGAQITNMMVLLDGVAQSTDDNGVFSGIQLKNGSVLKIYADGKPVSPYTVAFAAEDGASAAVTYDKVLALSDLNSSLTCYKGTEFVITPGEGTAVMLDGEALTPAEDGTCTFAVTKSHKVELTVAAGPTDAFVLTPDPETEVESLEEIVITFPDATTVVRNADLAEDEVMFYAPDWSYAAYEITVTEVEGAEHPSFAFHFAPAPVAQKGYKLYIPEGFFTVDGKPSQEVMVTYTLKKAAGGDVEYMFDPADVIVNEWGVMVTVIFDEAYMVEAGDELMEKLTVAFNGEVVSADEIMMMAEGNMFMLGLDYDKYFGASGELYLKMEAGALSLSGTPSPELEHTWSVILPKTYTFSITPDGSETVNSLETIYVSVPEADTIEVFNEYGVTLEQAGYDSGRYIANAPEIAVVEDAEVPTVMLTFNPAPTVKGNYRLTLRDGAFTLDGVQGSPEWTVNYSLDTSSGVEGVAAEAAADGGAIYTLQGIRVNADWNDLPAGLYIRNGKKEVKK